MPLKRGLVWLLVAVCSTAVTAGPVPQDLPCGIRTPARVVAVADVHGAFDAWVGILQAAGLIDDEHRWAGGDAIYVQLGDVVDRGADARRVLDLMRDLERDAERAGGRVLYLLGNHEVMRMQGDLRYVHPAEYDSFRTSRSSDVRERAWPVVRDNRRAAARAAGERFDERASAREFFESTPLGLVELQVAFGRQGDYGRWLRRHDVVAQVNGVFYVHGGISPAVAELGCEAIATETRRELRENRFTDPRRSLLLGREDGPLWYRGLVDGSATAADVSRVLTSLDVTRIVVGHTTTADPQIASRFGGEVLAIDTGMLGGQWYPGGVASALEIHGASVTAIYADRRERLVDPSVR